MSNSKQLRKRRRYDEYEIMYVDSAKSVLLHRPTWCDSFERVAEFWDLSAAERVRDKLNAAERHECPELPERESIEEHQRLREAIGAIWEDAQADGRADDPNIAEAAFRAGLTDREAQ